MSGPRLLIGSQGTEEGENGEEIEGKTPGGPEKRPARVGAGGRAQANGARRSARWRRARRLRGELGNRARLDPNRKGQRQRRCGNRSSRSRRRRRLIGRPSRGAPAGSRPRVG